MKKGTRRFIREQAVYYGDRLDVNIYTVWQQKGKRRKKCKPTREAQKKLNDRNSEQRMRRIADMNFSRKDLALHLTYEGEEPQSYEQVERDVKNYIRRVRRAHKAAGLPMPKYMIRISGGDGTRWHVHLMISGGFDRDRLEEMWLLGRANTKRLQFENGTIAPLTMYMSGQKKGYRRWIGSRNLAMPQPVEQDGRLTVEHMRTVADAVESKVAANLFESIYPGYELEDAVCEMNTVNRQIYIRVSLRKKPGKKKAPARKWAGAVAAFLEGDEL